MGALILRRYATVLLAKTADHTYVECGSGAKAWACWGGKAGGKVYREGPGSTRRADAIAEADEKAGISCYLINGVCHQAANRILKPARITADGVRGYTLSVALFGPFGRERTRIGDCQAPLREYPHITGDLPECVVGAPQGVQGPLPVERNVMHDFRDEVYMSSVAAVYATSASLNSPTVAQLFHSQLELFQLLVDHRVRRSQGELRQAKLNRLMKARVDFESGRLAVEHEIYGFGQRHEFAAEFNDLTLRFQDDVAHALDSHEYQALLGLSRDERIVLADPDILHANYEPGPGPRGAKP